MQRSKFNRDAVCKYVEAQLMCAYVILGPNRISSELTPCGVRHGEFLVTGIGWVAIQQSGLMH